MATVTKFEDLQIWKLAREIVNDVYCSTKKEDFSRDFALRNQIRRSAISILSNIAEGFESGTDNQFARYLKIAKGSAGECRAQLYVAADQEYISDEEFRSVQRKLINCSMKISKLISYLNGGSNYTNELEIIYES